MESGVCGHSALLLILFICFTSEGEAIRYHVVTHTSNSWYSGTDANVWIEFRGRFGNSGWHKIAGSHERGDTNHNDVYTKDVGPILRIGVKRDDHGSNDDWKTTRFEVTKGSESYRFPCDCWITNNEIHAEYSCNGRGKGRDACNYHGTCEPYGRCSCDKHCYLTNSNCRQCPHLDYCVQQKPCTSASDMQCYSCEKGYFLAGFRCKKCPDLDYCVKQKPCTSASDMQCYSCEKGYFLAGVRCKKCPHLDNCVKQKPCTSASDMECYKCQKGYYSAGVRCKKCPDLDYCVKQKPCTSASDMQCYSCEKGYFLAGVRCKKCPHLDNCVKQKPCTSASDMECYKCQKGYYSAGVRCKSVCPSSVLVEDSTKNKCYFVSTFQRSRSQAKDLCESFGGMLAKVEDNADHQFLIDHIDKGRSYWVGMNDIETESRYVWADNSPVTWFAWKADQPNGDTAENCVIYGSTQTWQDYDCAATFYFLCQLDRMESSMFRKVDQIEHATTLNTITTRDHVECVWDCVRMPDCRAVVISVDTTSNNCELLKAGGSLTVSSSPDVNLYKHSSFELATL